MAKQQTLKTGNPEAKKPGKAKEIVRTNLGTELDALCDAFLGVVAESASLSEELGEITRKAAKLVTEETLPAFIGGCAELCDVAGLTSGSVKVYLSNMRGVLRAMLAGWNPPADVTTLRAMYDAIPGEHRGKGANKGNRTPRQPAADGGADGKPTAQAVTDPKRVDMETAIRRIFGHYDEALANAVEYAVSHEAMFTRWAAASAKAAQQVPHLKAA